MKPILWKQRRIKLTVLSRCSYSWSALVRSNKARQGLVFLVLPRQSPLWSHLHDTRNQPSLFREFIYHLVNICSCPTTRDEIDHSLRNVLVRDPEESFLSLGLVLGLLRLLKGPLGIHQEVLSEARRQTVTEAGARGINQPHLTNEAIFLTVTGCWMHVKWLGRSVCPMSLSLLRVESIPCRPY